MLAAIERGKTLDEAADRLKALSAADRRLARAMVMFALRRNGDISALLEKHVKRGIPGRPHLARALLKIGAVQILLMETPDHAAVAETVNACGRGEAPYRGLINAVLRKLAAEAEKDGLPCAPLSNFPAWMTEQWERDYGSGTARLIADAHCRKPPLDLRFKTPAGAEAWLADASGFSGLSARLLAPGHVRIGGAVEIETLPGYEAGAWWVQDYAAGLPAVWLNEILEDGARILDLCAAPGGKTMQLAAQGHKVTAVDVSPARLNRLRENLARTGLKADILTADVLDGTTEILPGGKFDAVLLDAPCSATGTMRRHPDIPLRRKEKDVPALTELQKSMMERADRWVRPGGVLAYATCSLDPREGERQMADFLERHPDYGACAPKGLPDSLSRNGHLRTTPADRADEGGMDGFFACILQKAGA